MYLSKSDFKVAQTCPTKLYYKKLKYPSNLDDNPYLEFLADGGYMIETIAKLMFPSGVEVPFGTPEASAAATARLLQQKEVVLFEATVISGNRTARIDILEKKGNQLRLIEVKAKGVRLDVLSSPFRGAADESVLRFWKGMMDKYGNEKEYNRQIINGFKKGESPEIVIVVDKLLTGFDAPRNIVLYLARSLKEHTLLQAIARVNRLYPSKDFGFIIDYYGVVTQLHEALELYSTLEGKFDSSDLDGTLTDISAELKQLPGLHDAVWDLFRSITNKKDEEAYELFLADEDKRDEFYGHLSRFCRVLRMALASVPWLTSTPEATVQRYKQDALFFQKLRASIKIRYAEEIDYRDYEKQIQKMLNTYVTAGEVIQVVEPVNIFEREAFEQEVAKVKSPRAKADAIANRTKKTITEKMDEDPFFYRKFSQLLEQTIADYKQHRLSEAQYLAKVIEIMESVRDGRTKDGPPVLQQRDLARAFYGSLQDLIPPTGSPQATEAFKDSTPAYATSAPPPDVLAEAACSLEDIIRRHAVVRWRDNEDAQNRMRNDLDDYFFDFQKRVGIQLSLPQLDSIVEATIRIAQNRPQDV